MANLSHFGQIADIAELAARCYCDFCDVVFESKLLVLNSEALTFNPITVVERRTCEKSIDRK